MQVLSSSFASYDLFVRPSETQQLVGSRRPMLKFAETWGCCPQTAVLHAGKRSFTAGQEPRIPKFTVFATSRGDQNDSGQSYPLGRRHQPWGAFPFGLGTALEDTAGGTSRSMRSNADPARLSRHDELYLEARQAEEQWA
eukprot:5528784-Amphidinium_carterae.2